MFDPALIARAERLLARCRSLGLRLCCAESCTGGLLTALLTEIPGASEVVDRALVTYSNRAKVELLGVREESLARHGAVSERVAREMAEGALARSHAHIALAITGIAGPGGGTPHKPVGLVHIAGVRASLCLHRAHRFDGDRTQVRLRAVAAALDLLDALLADRGLA